MENMALRAIGRTPAAAGRSAPTQNLVLTGISLFETPDPYLGVNPVLTRCPKGMPGTQTNAKAPSPERALSDDEIVGKNQSLLRFIPITTVT